MSPLKIALSELESSDAEVFRATLERLAGRLSHHWEWADLIDAIVVVVDMDSFFGHMAWLKASGSGKTVITIARSGCVHGSDLVLGKPLDDDALAVLLEQVAGTIDESDGGLHSAHATPTHTARVALDSASAPAEAQATLPAPAAQAAPSPVTSVASPELAKAIEGVTSANKANRVADDAKPQTRPETPATAAPQEPEPINVAELIVRRFPIQAGRVADCDLVVDSEHGVYYAGDALKPLQDPLERKPSSLHTLDAAELATVRQRKPLPLARLRWFAGLVATPGILARGLQEDERYKLSRWPQTEREFPRHFRIATAMMKQAATPAELAVASGVPLAEVIDYINASKAAGWLAVECDEPLAVEEESAQTVRLSRFRKPFGR